MARGITTEDRLSAVANNGYDRLDNRFRGLLGDPPVKSPPLPTVTPAAAPVVRPNVTAPESGNAGSAQRITPEDRIAAAAKSGLAAIKNGFEGQAPALFKDKRKTYNQFAPGTPTVAAQNRMEGALKQLPAEAAKGTARLAGNVMDTARDISANNLGGKYTGAALGALGNRLANDRALNEVALDRPGAWTQRRGASVSMNENIASPPAAMGAQERVREVRGVLQPDGSRMVIDQRPVAMSAASPASAAVDAKQKLRDSRAVQPSALSMGPDSGWFRNESTGEVATMGSDGKISLRDASGNEIDRATGRLGRPTPQQQAGNGVQRVGNMDVTFAPGTTPDQRQAFLTDPVKPEGQMIQYNNRALAEADRQDYMRSKEQAQGPQLYTLENSPNMGWRERLALNDKIMDADRQRKADATTGQQAMALETARSTNNLANSRLLGEDTRNAAQTQSAKAETSLRQMEIDQARNVMDLQSQLDDPNLSTEKRRQIENRLYAIQGKPQQKYQITTRKTTDPITGAVTETPYMVDTEGRASEIGGTGGQVSPEMSIVNSNPEYKKRFDAASPEEREVLLSKVRTRLAGQQ